MKLISKPAAGRSLRETADDLVVLSADQKELANLAMILTAGIDADPVIRNVSERQTRALAVKIAAFAQTVDDTEAFSLTLSELRDIDMIALTVSTLGNDPYFPSLEVLGEDEVDRISRELDALSKSAWSMPS